MCMEDINIGRGSVGQPRLTAIPANSTLQICEQDPHRVALTISNDGATVIRLLPLGTPNAAGFGIALNAGTPFLTMRVEDYGTLVTQAWQAAVGVGGCNVTVIETTLVREP